MTCSETVLSGVSFNLLKLRVLWIGSMSPNSLAKIIMNFSVAQWLSIPVLDQTALVRIPASPVTINLRQLS